MTNAIVINLALWGMIVCAAFELWTRFGY